MVQVKILEGQKQDKRKCRRLEEILKTKHKLMKQKQRKQYNESMNQREDKQDTPLVQMTKRKKGLTLTEAKIHKEPL